MRGPTCLTVGQDHGSGFFPRDWPLAGCMAIMSSTVQSSSVGRSAWVRTSILAYASVILNNVSLRCNIAHDSMANSNGGSLKFRCWWSDGFSVFSDFYKAV